MVCSGTRKIQKDHEVICENCGVVYEDVYEELNAVVSKTIQNPIGSKNLIDSKLNLLHINKEKTARIMEKNDRQSYDFWSCCDALNLHRSVKDTAFEMFKKLRPEKLGLGKTAVFCIYQACVVCEILCDSDAILQTVRHHFKLKRILTLSNCIYTIKPIAIELNIAHTHESTSVSFLIRKHISPKYHVRAGKMIRSFPTNDMETNAKRIQNYLRCYD